MKLFKCTDKKLADIGFVKTNDDKYGVEYERIDHAHGFTQKVHILRKDNGRHIVQSYDPSLMDSKGIGNTCVGLTAYEMELFVKAAKKRGLYSRAEAEAALEKEAHDADT